MAELALLKLSIEVQRFPRLRLGELSERMVGGRGGGGQFIETRLAQAGSGPLPPELLHFPKYSDAFNEYLTR
jgi:hypothetical protein